jgi:hypothetical protein
MKNSKENIKKSQIKPLAERWSSRGPQLQTGKFVTSHSDFRTIVERF